MPSRARSLLVAGIGVALLGASVTGTGTSAGASGSTSATTALAGSLASLVGNVDVAPSPAREQAPAKTRCRKVKVPYETATAVTTAAAAEARPKVPTVTVCANWTEFEKANDALQANTLSVSSVQRRVGDKDIAVKVVGMVKVVTSKGAPQLKRLVPFPNVSSGTAKKYRRSKYTVYEIFAPVRPPWNIPSETWKVRHHEAGGREEPPPTAAGQVHRVLAAPVLSAMRLEDDLER